MFLIHCFWLFVMRAVTIAHTQKRWSNKVNKKWRPPTGIARLQTTSITAQLVEGPFPQYKHYLLDFVTTTLGIGQPVAVVVHVDYF